MYKINIIYVKELTELKELFIKDSQLPLSLKKIILTIKKVFGIATINQNGVCILPYKDIEHFTRIKLYYIRKILLKLKLPIILSDYLESITELKQTLLASNIKLLDGTNFSNYLIPEIIKYICKMMNQKLEEQEITILIEKTTIDNEKLILELARMIKGLKIVTTKIPLFQKLEKELESKFGIACQITNNKRKSLLKSKIIINLDFSEELLNNFNLNTKAIIIDVNKKVYIHSKAFSGIHVYDYELNSDNEHMAKKEFTMKKLYASRVFGKNYEQIRKIIEQEKVRVINLIGINGIIHYSEFTRLTRN